MKKLFLLSLITIFAAGLVMFGCDSSDDDKVTPPGSENDPAYLTFISQFEGVDEITGENVEMAFMFMEEIMDSQPLKSSKWSSNTKASSINDLSLVYHEAICIPWSLARGAWGIPEKDLGYLYGLVHAGLPYLSLSPSQAELGRVRTMCTLNQRLALIEMTNHRFLDDIYRRQQSVFADGTTVTIDLDKDTYQIVPKL